MYFETTLNSRLFARLASVLASLLVLSLLATAPVWAQARVQIIHNAPDPDASTVDIYVDDDNTPTADDIDFQDATGFMDVTPGTYDLAIAPEGSNARGDALHSEEYTFASGGTYVIVVTGVADPGEFQDNPDGEDISLGFVVNDQGQESGSTTGEVDVFGVHGTPDAPTVDIVLREGSIMVDDVTYSGRTDYTGLATTTEDVILDVTTQENQMVFGSFETGLVQEERAFTLLTSGFLTPDDEAAGSPGFALLAVRDDGMVYNLVQVASPTLVINEFLADPDGYDANGDGVADNSEDEFVEVLNASTEAVDISGYEITDEADNSYTFPGGTTLEPGTAATVFGGGSPQGIPGFTDTGLPGLNNDGDVITLTDDGGTAVAQVSYGTSGDEPVGSGESTARNPDAVGAFALNSDFSGEAATPGYDNTANTPLPVELVSFEASLDGREVVLNWKTASEENNAGFEVQQKAQGTFQRIGYVEGVGTTEEAQSYSFHTEELELGTQVFRLKQVDYDGTTSYSHEVEVQVELAEAFELSEAYPNPFNDRTAFTLAVNEAQDVSVEVYDALGRRVALLHEGTVAPDKTHHFRVEGSELSSGVYLIRVEGETFSEVRRAVLVK